MEINDFGWAIRSIKAGEKVRRKWWGENAFIVYMAALQLPPYTPLDSQPYIAFFTADSKWQPGWIPTQDDMLAEDWEIAE